jgi:hypothetical protein
MYGCTSRRSGAYGRPGSWASRLAAPAKARASPSSPGFRKSNSDQRSDRRFSIGVPVSAMRLAAVSCFTARDCCAPAFLMACASSSTTSRQGRSRSAAERATMP